MHIIAKRTLQEYWAKHLECKAPLTEWYRSVKKAAWGSPNELKREYPKASILANGRIVFNILGNRYRLIVKVQY